jgi:hypothetical protein
VWLRESGKYRVLWGVTAACLLLGGCVPPALQAALLKPHVDNANRAAKLYTPEVKAHCIASLEKVYPNGVEFVEPFRFDAGAAQFVGKYVLHVLNPQSYESRDGTAALITRCHSTNGWGNKLLHYCGCFYSLKGESLELIRTLNGADFTKTIHVGGYVR